ncbi:50S ribosomal protein L28 [Candidatus Margulisiibacteriota bacterium]
MRKCIICDKKPKTGNKVSHSNIKTKRMWRPNLQKIRIMLNGSVRREYVCTKCLKAGKVTKAT